MPHDKKPKLPTWIIVTTDGDSSTTLHGSTNDDQLALDLLRAFPGSVAINKPKTKVPKPKTPKVPK